MNIGIIGAGFFGEKHAQALAKLDSMTLVASSRTDASALQAFTKRYGGKAHVRYQDLLDDPEVEAVVIATPHATHEEIATAAARAGKHVLLEKPMAHTPAACARLLEAVRSAGVKLVLGHVTHFSRAYRLAKEIIDAGEVGEVVTGLSIMRKRWHEPNRRWWHLERAQGGGVLLTGGIHAIDRLTWLVGSGATSVSASVQTRFHDQAADDTGVLFIRYANGATGVVFSVGYAVGAPRHDTELTCTRGILRVDSVKGVEVGSDEAMRHVPDSGFAGWTDEALVEQWSAFRRTVEAGAPPAVSGEFALHVMKILFAAESSSERQEEVRI